VWLLRKFSEDLEGCETCKTIVICLGKSLTGLRQYLKMGKQKTDNIFGCVFVTVEKKRLLGGLTCFLEIQKVAGA